jgi:Protein of unknown function (DUF3761)
MRNFWLGYIALACVGIYSSQTHQQPSPISTPASVYAAPNQTPVPIGPDETNRHNAQPEFTQTPSDDEQEKSPELSRDRHYINSDGDSVHSPSYSKTVPAGATAQCSDGTYSVSQQRRGTCSDHGSVGGCTEPMAAVPCLSAPRASC